MFDVGSYYDALQTPTMDSYVSPLTSRELDELRELVRDYPEKVLDRLCMLNSLSNLNSQEQLQVVGLLTDYGGDYGDRQALTKAIELGGSVDQDELDSVDRSMLNYRIGTAFSNRTEITRPEKEWSWENEDIEEAIRYFRRSIREEGMDDLPLLEQCRALTNLGNTYSRIGRFIEAFDFWNEALIRNPHFYQSRGQRGIGYHMYAEHLSDVRHKKALLAKSYRELNTAVYAPIHKSQKHQFNRYLSYLRASPFDLDSDVVGFGEPDLGESETEKAYRNWCLKHRLFLNPLNEVTDESIAAEDVQDLKPLFSDRGSKIITCLGLWNNLVEEFVTARYQLYQGFHPDRVHFADKDVEQTNTLDYSIHSVYVEQLKIALRTAYSILDKIGQFLNYYYEFGRKSNKVSFKDIWYEPRDSYDLREEFREKANLPLRGLYWLSKDFKSGEDGDGLYVEGSLDTGGEELKELRNGLEHRYVKITEFGNISRGRLDDELATVMGRGEFEEKALSMVRKARAGLLYLSLAVFHEERTNMDSESIHAPLELGQHSNNLR